MTGTKDKALIPFSSPLDFIFSNSLVFAIKSAMPNVALLISVAKSSMAVAVVAIDLSLDNKTKESSKPLPIISLAFSAEAVKRSIFPA